MRFGHITREHPDALERVFEDVDSYVHRQDYGDTAESQIVTRSVVTSSSRNSKSSKSSSRASDRSKKAKAELLRREVELKNLLKRQEMERQMERQIADSFRTTFSVSCRCTQLQCLKLCKGQTGRVILIY